MIIPIIAKNDKTIGTASVERIGAGARDFSVTFYLQPGFEFADEVKTRMERSLITIARNEEKKRQLNVSVWEGK